MIKKIALFVLSVFIVVSSAQAQSSLKRVEPLNWWVGMKHQDLQLLIYGEKIGHLYPTFSYEGVSLTKVVRTENPNYIFAYLSIGSQAKAGTMKVDLLDEKGVAQHSFAYELKERDAGSADREGFNTSDVMYLVTPDRFVNGDPTNDQIEGMREQSLDRTAGYKRHGGDIQGLEDSLDYIKDMGFTAIWLNPVLENDQPDASYHGYAATDFYKVDRRFGTNEHYRRFVKKAKKQGIKTIMDMILNHSGHKHWFVEDKPTKDWVNFGGSYVNTSHRRQANIDAYASDYDRKMFTDGWFVASMPDLNQRNELMSDYLIQNTIWWVEYADLSGIRMDTYPYPDKHFMTEWTCRLAEEYPSFNVVGEEWFNDPAIVSYWQRGKKNHDGYTSCLRSLMDFPIQEAFRDALKTDDKHWGQGLMKLYDKLVLDFQYPEPEELVVFPDNHDMDRIHTQMGEDADFTRMSLAYFATMRGVPQFYYGTEILMENSAKPGDHGLIRTDFPGGWAGDAVNAFTGKGLTAEQKKTQVYLKKLLQWRKNAKVIHTGDLMHFVPENGVYVFFRYMKSGEKVMVVLNKNDAETRLPLARYAEMLSGRIGVVDVISQEKQDLSQGVLLLDAKTTHIFEVQ
ncbi:glycoside hydrolase family 13 protein [Temperatibacter marinus]|uniref:Glycoside hydrolase family 13 protein n=1 Tax=Temperatibacter marinus TaxID=1456591 RepID=A0AA52EHM0_9PROT|nr:glycoside hydrolase family 13 protein [Temperatibacter marinus]WND03808.1 glycoside hydrolase family 13 protein [Temperatibacter marinus]